MSGYDLNYSFASIPVEQLPDMLDSVVSSLENQLNANSTPEAVSSTIGFKGSLSAIGLPIVDYFPQPNDWGFYTDSDSGLFYIVRNVNGVITTSAMT